MVLGKLPVPGRPTIWMIIGQGPLALAVGAVGWLFWIQRLFETAFQSLSDRLKERGRKRREKIEECKNVQTTSSRSYCKRNRPLPYYHPNCRNLPHMCG